MITASNENCVTFFSGKKKSYDLKLTCGSHFGNQVSHTIAVAELKINVIFLHFGIANYTTTSCNSSMVATLKTNTASPRHPSKYANIVVVLYRR